MARIFVSSTSKDLEECREKVRTALRRIENEDIAMEYFVAEDIWPLDKCLEKVASCDLYIGIFALRYGKIPDGYDKSMTELEYREAVKTGKDCLIFLLHEDALWPSKFVDRGKDAERIAALRDEFSEKKIVSFFKSAEELATLVVEAVHNWENKRRIQTPSGAANQENSNHYNPSTLPNYPDTLKEFVTTNRAEELYNALKYLENHRILLLSGMGGVGKTTIARALIDKRSVNVPMPFWFDFGQNKDAKLGDILEKLASYLNSPDIAKFREEKREPEKKDIDKLTDKLQAGNPAWLVFDNLETVLENVYFQNDEIDLFFTCLQNSTHQAKIIITSRTFPKLKNGQDLIGVIGEEKKDIKGLKINFAVDYLVKNGLDDLELCKLEELAEGVDGHPLALQLLVGLVKEVGAEDILEDLSIYQEQLQDTILIARKLFDKLAGEEKELLERISVYREPVRRKGLKEMFSEDTQNNAIDKLLNKSLLETDHKGKYWLHPLVQEFSYEDLKNKKEAHKIAYNYYISLGIPENPAKEDIQPAIEAHYHACEAGEYDLAADIILESNLLYLLYFWEHPRTLIELYEKLLPRNHSKDEPILKDKWTHEAILGNLGIAYSDLGDTKKAIDYNEQALKIAREIGDGRGEGNALGNLGNAHSDLGDAKKAIDYYEQALKIAREIGDRSGEGNQLGNLGTAYYQLGDAKNAIDYYEQALKIAREIGDRRGEGAGLGNLGLAYSDLGDAKKAIDYNEQALKIAREIGDRSGEGNLLGNLGIAYKNLGDVKKAIDYYEQALKIAKEIGNRRGEGNLLGNLGIAYKNLGDVKKAIDYYEQALKIAKEIGNRRGEGNLLGNLGNAYSDLEDAKKAIDYYEQALKIAREIGDRRGEGNWLGGLGNAYYQLGDAKNAIDYYEQALKIAREIGDRSGEGICLGNLGLAYNDLGETKKAIDYYEQALKINPENNSVWYNKACAHSSMNKKSEALADLKRAVELDPINKELAKSDKDFEKLREDRDFLDIITPNQA